MSDKPTTLPAWATTGTATEPSAGSKLVGFIPGAKWAAQHANWLLFNIYLWILWLDGGYLTRASLTDDTPVQGYTDQDANVKAWIDHCGYRMGQVIEENYWWRGADTYASGDLVSLGSPLYVTTEDVGYAVSTVLPPSSVIGVNMIQVACPASPTATNGALISCDDGSTGGEFFGSLDDAIAVLETTVMVEQAAASASTVYIGFHEPSSNPGNFESTSRSSCCLILDYGETVFEGMTCDGTTLSKATTSTTCTVNTLYHVRVEYHGANTPHGVDQSGAVSRFFIDGVLVLEKTTNQPINADYMGPVLGVQGLSTGTAGDVFFGPMRWAVNFVPSSQVPDAV